MKTYHKEESKSFRRSSVESNLMKSLETVEIRLELQSLNKVSKSIEEHYNTKTSFEEKIIIDSRYHYNL